MIFRELGKRASEFAGFPLSEVFEEVNEFLNGRPSERAYINTKPVQEQVQVLMRAGYRLYPNTNGGYLPASAWGQKDTMYLLDPKGARHSSDQIHKQLFWGLVKEGKVSACDKETFLRGEALLIRRVAFLLMTLSEEERALKDLGRKPNS